MAQDSCSITITVLAAAGLNILPAGTALTLRVGDTGYLAVGVESVDGFIGEATFEFTCSPQLQVSFSTPNVVQMDGVTAMGTNLDIHVPEGEVPGEYGVEIIVSGEHTGT